MPPSTPTKSEPVPDSWSLLLVYDSKTYCIRQGMLYHRAYRLYSQLVPVVPTHTSIFIKRDADFLTP